MVLYHGIACVNLDSGLSQRWLGLAHGLGTCFVVSHGIVPWYCMWLSLYKAWGGSIVYKPGSERWLARLARMANFGHVMKIFIGAGFLRMGFPRYIVCLYVVSCFNVYFLLIIMLMLLAFNLTIITSPLNNWLYVFLRNFVNKDKK